jgi:hypothetical protein
MKYLIISAITLAALIFLLVRPQSDFHTDSLIPDIISSSVTNVYSDDFEKYWYAGEAELTGYELTQARYGELHKGTATMIFVTEPFSRSKHVKLDDPSKSRSDEISVLKLNASRKFLTGIYPYSMMTSTFTPVNDSEYTHALKSNITSQEWCGQVFQQLNLSENNYQFSSYSYFESEGDKKKSIAKEFLEDEFFNIIRINPALLPTGKANVIPSLYAGRFLHEEVKAYEAEITRADTTWNNKLVKFYHIQYPHNTREMTIFYQPSFPYTIEGWEDTSKGIGDQMLTTKAVRKNTIKTDYWNKHNNADRGMYDALYQ